MRFTSVILSGFFLVALSGCAAQKSPVAQTGTGAQATGTGVVEVTFDSLKALAEKGDADAQFNVGSMYMEGTETKKDVSKAIEWYTKAAEQKNALAEFNLGILYYDGLDIPSDYEKARSWFEKSAAQGNIRAIYNLGIVHYRGQGVALDFAKALPLFQKSAMGGFPDGAFNTGVMYAKGEGVKQSPVDAYAWFLVAIDLGDANAEAVMAPLVEQLSPAEKLQGQKKAQEILKKVAKPAL